MWFPCLPKSFWTTHFNFRGRSQTKKNQGFIYTLFFLIMGPVFWPVSLPSATINPEYHQICSLVDATKTYKWWFSVPTINGSGLFSEWKFRFSLFCQFINGIFFFSLILGTRKPWEAPHSRLGNMNVYVAVMFLHWKITSNQYSSPSKGKHISNERGDVRRILRSILNFFLFIPLHRFLLLTMLFHPEIGKAIIFYFQSENTYNSFANLLRSQCETVWPKSKIHPLLWFFLVDDANLLHTIGFITFCTFSSRDWHSIHN